MLHNKNAWGLLVAVLGLAGLLFYRSSMNLIRKLDMINDKLFDLKLITANDFATGSVIDPELYKKFKDENEHKTTQNQEKEESMIHLFEEAITKRIEEVVGEKITKDEKEAAEKKRQDEMHKEHQ